MYVQSGKSVKEEVKGEGIGESERIRKGIRS